ncbi:MAG: hypothetical protein LUD46_16755, partial [Parabacteroides sp.]|nr:hypothetical protein [Parabacteroides sp.]
NIFYKPLLQHFGHFSHLFSCETINNLSDIKAMKTLRLFLMGVGVLFTSLTFQSCLDDDDTD